ncbi:MAG TPA: MATE family efflux transporter [Ktedonobacterales bacterium]|nr:MATE family efflux transporter [Ktedonobacterales bacterium]
MRAILPTKSRRVAASLVTAHRSWRPGAVVSGMVGIVARRGLRAHVARPRGEHPTVSDRELRGRVWALALPAIGEQLLTLGVGTSDTFLSGHLSSAATAHLGYGRATAVTAVGVASTAAWVAMTAFFAINIGVTALVARATGAKDRRLAGHAAGQGIMLGLVAGCVLLLAAVPLATFIARVLGVDGQVADLVATFLRVYSLAFPATGAASACTAAMRGAGDARRPLAVMLCVNGINILASWSLMNGVPGLGIAPIGVLGSACGAAAGWVVGCGVALTMLSRRHPRAPQITRAALRPNWPLAQRVLRVGLPSAAELTVFQLGIISFLRFVVPLGAAAYAANTAINTVESIGTLPGIGFSVATTTIVGQALGAADPALAQRAIWASLRPCLLVMSAVALVVGLLPHVVLGMFVADASVLQAGGTAMRLSFFTLPASGAAFVFIGALRGAGDTKFPVLVRAAGTWGVRVPLALLVIPLLGLPGARLAMVVDFCTEASITYLRVRSGRWHRTSV